MEDTRVGLVGGLSWESTAQYYRRLNQGVSKDDPWHQPRLVIDSLDFAVVNRAQEAGDRDAVTAEVVAAARRLQAAGCTHLALCANTAHEEAEAVAVAVDAELVDIRTAVAEGVRRLGGSSLGLLATRYCIERDFYVRAIEHQGVTVVRPNPGQTDELHRIIVDELALGVVTEPSRRAVTAIAADLRACGADVVGLCCTELGMLVSEVEVGVCVDSLDEHVRAILEVLEPPDRHAGV